ncbi:hypothetical protein CPB83DRAFT_898561 [Crepidotus variabilis]|uniref:Copper transport protein n=1 Tax=Crepidotus variabilis TaxID=179855 RepID=A0A9P6E712_9AGAR|nr:hypothetical protein CPB83DRAFT_898561 [Crepidotus variabilis]
MDGMDMGGAPAMAQGHMIPYLHLKAGVTLFFDGWVPQTSSSVVGACFGLFLVGIVDRLLAATRSSAENFWSGGIARLSSHGRAIYAALPDKRIGNFERSQTPLSILAAARRTFSPPSTPTNDLVRGSIHVIQATLGFAFMLIVM